MRHLSIRFLVGLRRPTDFTSSSLGVLADLEHRADVIESFLIRAYPSGTCTRATGHWDGAEEPSIVYEAVVLDLPLARATARMVAGRLAELHKQEAVGVVMAPVDFYLEGPR
jgi:hypothetical protein